MVYLLIMGRGRIRAVSDAIIKNAPADDSMPMITWPALMFAASRNDRVIGRM